MRFPSLRRTWSSAQVVVRLLGLGGLLLSSQAWAQLVSRDAARLIPPYEGPLPAFVEPVDAGALNMLQTVEAPGTIFAGHLCVKDGQRYADAYQSTYCAQPPLNFDKPFRRFPVAIKMFEPTDPQDVRTYRYGSDSGQHLKRFEIHEPHLILHALHHGKMVSDGKGRARFAEQPIDRSVVLRRGEIYRWALLLGGQSGGQRHQFYVKIMLPMASKYLYPRFSPLHRGEPQWHRCSADLVQNSEAAPGRTVVVSEAFADQDSCKSYRSVRLPGRSGSPPMQVHVFQRDVPIGGAVPIGALGQTLRIDDKDPAGEYRIQVWMLGKLLTSLTFEVEL